MKSALIIVDVQNDFVEGGSLGVDGGRAVAKNIAEFLAKNKDKFDVVMATRDWHIDPGSHFDNWPVHCVADTEGAEIQEDIQNALDTYAPNYRLISKGMYSDGYSGFEGVELSTKHPVGTILADNVINEAVVVGIATDFCVRATAIDAEKNVYLTTTVLTDLTAGVAADSTEKALTEMKEKGITLTTAKEWEATK